MAVFESHLGLHDNLPVYYHCSNIYKEPRVANWHDNLEILYTMDGEGYILCGAIKYPVKKGDVLVVNPYTIHSVNTDTEIRSACFIVDNDFCKKNGINMEEIEFTAYVRSPVVSSLCEKLLEELRGTLEFKNTAVRAVLLQLMLTLSRHHSRRTVLEKMRRDSMSDGMLLAIGYIRSHFNEKLTLDKLAFEAGLSKFYFSREFKRLTGVTPITYINMLRCNEAKKLLAQGECSIHDISGQCGFINDSYFSKTYKKYSGNLPSKSGKKQDSVI